VPKAEQTVIRKVVKKGGHGGHHGGSWKVAYADFVTAMMAFFLLMWLLNSVSPQKLVKLSDYFNDFNLFDQSSDKPAIKEGGGSVLNQPNTNPPPPLREVKEVSEIRQKLTPPPEELTPEKLHAELTTQIKQKLSDMQDQVLLDVTPEGVRVQITSRDGNPIFESGSERMTIAGQRALETVADSLRVLPNRIAIEGHTDARPFTGFGGRDNWDLSAERALAAKSSLLRWGIAPARIARVQGMAASLPLLVKDPTNERNRRISILVIEDKSKKDKEKEWEPGKDVGPPREPVKSDVVDPNAPEKLFPLQPVKPGDEQPQGGASPPGQQQ